MRKKISYSDVYDINSKTGALILGSNRLDDYATKFLSKYCSEALLNPMPLPVDDILTKMNLVVKEERLSSNLDVFGCCLFLNAEVKIYDAEKKEYFEKYFKAGTILIDPLSASLYGEGAKRNTLVHEIVHWEKDKTYFEILKIKNKRASEKLYPIMCRQSEVLYQPPEGSKTKENEVRWLEWQAHKLAPRILMPKISFIKKMQELIKSVDSCRKLVSGLSDFFIVSKQSVKYRIDEVGQMDSIKEFHDFEDEFKSLNSFRDYVKLSPYDAFMMVNSSEVLKEWISTGRYIFVEGYFVLAKEEYVNFVDGSFILSEKAKRNIKKCVVNIREEQRRNYSNVEKDYIGYAVLLKNDGIDAKILTFHPEYQINELRDPSASYDALISQVFNSDDIEEEKQLHKMVHDMDCTLCDCIKMLMNNRKIMYPEKFENLTLLHKNVHGKIKNNKANNLGKESLMAICVGLKLSIKKTELLFQKSNNKLNRYTEPDFTYIRILETVGVIPIEQFNTILEKKNMKTLGSDMRI